jgi:hypothetical protein
MLLSSLSEQCHIIAAGPDMKKIAALERKIDQTAAALWGITEKELKAIQKALKEMEQSGRKKESAESAKED